jgi:RNA polymerase sigma-70 factor (ECF subfamily)
MAAGGNRDDSAHARGATTSLSLLERARANDEEAWHRLVDLYGPLVYYWCQRKLPRGEIEDVFQEVFRAVATNMHAFRKEKPEHSFRAWLRVIVTSKINDCFRRLNHQPAASGGSAALGQLQEVAELAGTSPSSWESEPRAEVDILRSRLLKNALEKVRDGRRKEKTWQAFWRTVVEGRTSEETGIELQMTTNAVIQAKARTLHAVRMEILSCLEELADLDDLGVTQARVDRMLRDLRELLAEDLGKT